MSATTRGTLVEFMTCDLCRRENQSGIVYDRKGKRHASFCHGCIFTLARMYRRMQAKKRYDEAVKAGAAEWAKTKKN